MKKFFIVFAAFLLTHDGLAQNDGVVVSIDAPSYVDPGATFSGTIVMKNTGAIAWSRASLHSLAAENPQGIGHWGITRVDIPLETILVNPGESVTFTSNFTAPTLAGVYNFAWTMTQEVGYFGEIATLNVRVGQPSFRPGDIVILRVGDTKRFNLRGSPVCLQSFDTAGNLQTEIHLPIGGPEAVLSGSAQFAGMIDLTADGKSIVVGGYNKTNFINPLNNNSNLEAAGDGALVPRIVSTVDSAGYLTTGVRHLYTAGGQFRGAISDGNAEFWSGAINSGVLYLGTSQPETTLVDSPASTRDMRIQHGSIYFSSSDGLSTFDGLPKTPTPRRIVLSTNRFTQSTVAPSLKGFAINNAKTIAYVADLRRTDLAGGLNRFNGDGSGTNWTYAYTMTNAPKFLDDGANNRYAFQELAVDFTGADPKIYATAGYGSENPAGNYPINVNGNGSVLMSATDIGVNSLFTVLQTAPLVSAYYGLSFAPKSITDIVAPPTLFINSSGTTVTISWNGGGTLESSVNLTGPYSPIASSSPFIITPGGTNSFYRVRIP